MVAEYHGCQKEIHRGKDTLRVINQQVTNATSYRNPFIRPWWNLNRYSKKITF